MRKRTTNTTYELSEDEKNFIIEKHNVLSPLQIAKEIKRGFRTVQTFMFKNRMIPHVILRKNDLTDDEKTWILDNHLHTSVQDIAKHLKRCNETIYTHMRTNNLKVFKNKPWNSRKFGEIVTEAVEETNEEFFNVDARKGEYTWLV